MHFVVYSDVLDVVQAFLTFVASEPEVRVHAVTNTDEVRRVVDEFPIEGFAIPRVSVAAWWDCESQLTIPLKVPRIIAAVIDPGWSRQYVHDLGFDGLIVANLASPPYQLVRDFTQIVETCTTRGTRAPLDRGMLVDYPDLDEVTHGDEINRQILALVAIGREDREIAGAVCLSWQTVRNRISTMLKVSGMSNRTQLAVFYVHKTAQMNARVFETPTAIQTISLAS